MTLGTKQYVVTLTYTEAAPVSPTDSKPGLTFNTWVVPGAGEVAQAQANVLDKFVNMRSGGRSVSITSTVLHPTVPTRPNAPFAP